MRLPVILVADDSPDDRVLFEHMLRKGGVRNPVVFAENGNAAIALLRRSCLAAGGRRGDKPAIAFLDVNMQPADGFHVLKWIRRKRALQKTRVIMMTDSNKPADLNRAAELKADGYLLKYPRPETIAFLIRQASAVTAEHAKTKAPPG